MDKFSSHKNQRAFFFFCEFTPCDLCGFVSRLKISVSTDIYRYLDFTDISNISVNIFT